MSGDNNSSQCQSSDPNNSIQSTSIKSFEPYHKSISGSILHPAATNSSREIFSYLRHGNLDAFRRSLAVYHKDIFQIRNEHGQVNIELIHLIFIFIYCSSS